MMDANRNLVLVFNPPLVERWDFERLAAHVRDVAPDVHAVLWQNGSRPQDLPEMPDRPTMTFSPGPILGPRPARGTIFEGHLLRKSEEYAALERVGVNVPRWTLLTRGCMPDLSAFDRYVVVKPDIGGRGADVKITRKGRVRWSAPSTTLVKTFAGADCPRVVQDFVYTGPYPCSYRVTTLFGEPMWSWKVQAAPSRRPLRHRADFAGGEQGGGMSIVSSGTGCTFMPVDDPELREVARAAHRAFPDIPLIGVDLLRDADTGRVFVIETNAVGLTWHLSSPIGRSIQTEFAFDLDAIFDVRRHAARVLVDRTRQYAS